MLRILLFLGTNVAILLVLAVSFSVLGIEDYLLQQGVRLQLVPLLIFASIFGMGGAFISLAMSKWTAKRMTGAKVLEAPGNSTEAWLVSTVKRQAEQAGIGMPEVAVFQSPDPNAFATGMSRNNALVAVSTGLLQHMSQDEVEAVLAHEVTHVANGDMLTLALVQGVVNTFVIFLSRVIGHTVDRVVFKSRGHGPAFWITTIVAQVVLGILASIVVMWFSRRREFRADAGGAALAGSHKMIAALQRLKQSSEQPHLPDQLAAFGISGSVGGGLARLFMSHPPLDERIAALQSSALGGATAVSRGETVVRRR